MDSLLTNSLDQLVPDIISQTNTMDEATHNGNQDKLDINTFPPSTVLDNVNLDYFSNLASGTIDPFQLSISRNSEFQDPNIVDTSISTITGYDISKSGSGFLAKPTGLPSSSGHMEFTSQVDTAQPHVMKIFQTPKVSSSSDRAEVLLEGDMLQLIEELPTNSDVTITEETALQTQPANIPSKQLGHSCPHCQKVFKAKRDLSRHLLIHSDSRPFECSRCGKCFRQKMALKRHMLTHNSVRAFSCETCQKSFTQKAHLKAHISVAHSQDKPHKCLTCGRSFSLKTYLTLHMSTHTGEKDYVCPICHKAFSQRNNLTVHIATHSRIKLFTCKICSKEFSQKSNLNTHVKTQHNTEQYLNV